MTLAMNTVETAVDVVGAGSLTSRFGFFGRSAEAVVDDPWLTTVDKSSIIKQNVISNIADSQSARESSNFTIYAAKEDQILSGYNADIWTMTYLNKGDVVYGGLPGQSAYYTSEETVLASRNSRTNLFQSLQVRPDPDLGYRPAIGVYEVTQDIRIPTGIVYANPTLGIGGGDQFFISTFNKSLNLTNKIELGADYEDMPTYRIHP